MKSPRSVRNAVYTLLALCMVLSASVVTGFQPARASAQAASGNMTKAEVVKKVAPAVVTVYNMGGGGGLLGGEAQPQGAGTGFIISKDGYIVTNWHVVTGGDSYKVQLNDGRLVDAKLIGTDGHDDLAVVQIDPSEVPAVATFGDSSQLQVGEDVLAVGSPLGYFTNTVTGGIVSSIGRDLNQGNQSPECQDYSELIQHDAAINHGNSGGPLFNLRGEVIGVNTLGIPADNQGQPVQGLFFAVPSNKTKTMVDQMIKTGSAIRPYLGVSYYELNPALSSKNEIPVPFGALIKETAADSPAGEAGIQRNDIITAVNGTKIDGEHSFAGLMSQIGPDQKVSFTVYREGKEETVELTMGSQKIDDSQCKLGQ